MFAQYSDLTEKLAKFLGDKINLKGVAREKECHPEINHTSLFQYLPYVTYDEDKKLFLNKKSVGFMIETTPLTGANEETINILASILTDILPSNADLQFLLWASNKVGEAVDRFEKERSGKGEIFEWLAQKRSDFLKKGANESLLGSNSFIIRNFRLFITVSLSNASNNANQDHLCELRETIQSSLKSINMPSVMISVNNFLSIMRDLINPSKNVYANKGEWQEYDMLATQLTDPEYRVNVFPNHLLFENNENESIEMRALSVKEFPKSAPQWKMTDSIGQLFNASLQMPCPFLLNFCVRPLDVEKSSMHAQYQFLNKERTARSPLAKLKPLIHQEFDEWRFVRDRLAEGDRLVKTFYQVLIFTPENLASSHEQKVKDLFSANGWKLRNDSYLQLQSYFAMMPMMMSEGMFEDLKNFGRIKTMTAFNAINVAPLQGEWKGTQTPSLILPGRRGQLAFFNPFDNQEGNYNVAIAAAAGKGKSMLTQEYITNLVGSGGRVWVIDVGRSYENTCKLLGGSFIEFKQDALVSVNPFSIITDFDTSLAMLKPLLSAMVRNLSLASDEENTFLEQALKAAWERDGNHATITTIATWLKEQDSEICQNLSHLLYTYTKDGMYGRYFEGKATIDLSNPLVVLELQELKSKPDLQKIILLVLMYQISETMYLGNRSQRKSCIIDEAWDLLGGENAGAARFIEIGYRTARKHNANFVTITQSINDYFKNSTSIAAFENSDYTIVLGQKSESIDQLKNSDRFTMDAYSERLFKSLRKTDEYSECIIKGPSGLSIHRIIFDPFSRILYSSKGDEYEAVKNLTHQGMSLREAIEVVARKFNYA